ncbi:CAP domain-containing protein [Lacibacter sp. MH-610]|uniref:CAP domain-containing protein n=1 Tax=Lacibacter sp. MH-610 TaxID=3020883 RepID=UPI003891A7F6
MRYLKAVFLLLIYNLSFSQGSITLQDKPFVFNRPIDSVIWNTLKADVAFRELNMQEQMLFYWTNLMRQNPQTFYNDIVKEFIRQFPEANKPEVKSLERDIQKLKTPLPLLLPDANLGRMSAEHARDLSRRNGVISHRSSSGRDFVQRLKEVGSFRCGAENLFIGNPNPLEALITLLIDYGVPDKGHRVNLLDPTFERMGVSFSSLSNKKLVLVQVFACK